MNSLFKVYMSESVKEEIPKVLLSGMITQGEKVEEFEVKLKEIFEYPYILTLNSATSGITLAVRMIKDKYNLSNDDEVLTSPLTCMATNEPILANNMKLKWVDVEEDNPNISLDDLERKLNERSKIIMFVHWGGYPVDLDRLNNILDKHEKRYAFRPLVIEDCAHAFMSEYKGKKIGTSGNYCVFSLQAIKHLTTGDGGLIFLPGEEEYKRAKLLRWFGIDREHRSNGKDFRMEEDVKEWGYKFHMNDINATIGLCNLEGAIQNVEKCRDNAKYLTENFKDGEICHPYSEEFKSSYWLFTVLVENRDKFMEDMKEKGQMTSQVHKRNDTNSCFSEFRTLLPNLDKLEKRMVCIPCGWWVNFI